MRLKEELTLIKQENQTIREYLHTFKSLANKIALIDHSISDDDLALYILVFEELHDLLVGHEAYLHHLDMSPHTNWWQR